MKRFFAIMLAMVMAAACANQPESTRKMISYPTPYGLVLTIDPQFWTGDCNGLQEPKCLFESVHTKMNPVNVAVVSVRSSEASVVLERAHEFNDWDVRGFAKGFKCIKDSVKVTSESQSNETVAFASASGHKNEFSHLRMIQRFDCQSDGGYAYGDKVTEMLVKDFFTPPGAHFTIVIFRHFVMSLPGWNLSDFSMEAAQVKRLLGEAIISAVSGK